jgi:predicted HicB family RNase H-like nuclease
VVNEKQVVVELDEDLWAKAKSQAALQKRTVKEWLDEAIREKLSKFK